MLMMEVLNYQKAAELYNSAYSPGPRVQVARNSLASLQKCRKALSARCSCCCTCMMSCMIHTHVHRLSRPDSLIFKLWFSILRARFYEAEYRGCDVSATSTLNPTALCCSVLKAKHSLPQSNESRVVAPWAKIERAWRYENNFRLRCFKFVLALCGVLRSKMSCRPSLTKRQSFVTAVCYLIPIVLLS